MDNPEIPNVFEGTDVRSPQPSGAKGAVVGQGDTAAGTVSSCAGDRAADSDPGIAGTQTEKERFLALTGV